MYITFFRVKVKCFALKTEALCLRFLTVIGLAVNVGNKTPSAPLKQMTYLLGHDRN